MSLTTTLVAVSLSVMVNMSSLPKLGDWRMVSLFVPSLSMTWSVDVLPLSYLVALIVSVVFPVLVECFVWARSA